MSEFENVTAPPPPSGSPSAEEKQWALFAHLSSLVGVIIPFGSVLGPLVIWLIKKDTLPFVDDQGKEALNFNITVAIAFVISAILMLVVIGLFLMVLVGIAWLVLTIIATIKASNGEAYRYPFTLRLIK
ncbi:DUF4870 domain-containing protein [Pseudoxanthomonas sp. Root630]|uniref:DUF4870 domain-containing protein n=1 Tax=Pseudoxanthomonas sp. Root630 TaxID=1736574 RepID=UPI00070388AB|nr:DUF4870 domain-containing protein [Pseudoxanthomonas sp. Root630]KRA51898.1 orotate phosphoribosyltransferase [Pseudoxanthomonas sp. Root630]